jgi:isochorismate pyruvate lyase
MKAPDECTSIEDVRQAIDAIDREIIDALGHRFQYVKAITRFKKTEAEVRANERYQAVLQARRQWADDAGLDPDVVEQMYRLLIQYFIDEELKDLGLLDAQRP